MRTMTPTTAGYLLTAILLSSLLILNGCSEAKTHKKDTMIHSSTQTSQQALPDVFIRTGALSETAEWDRTIQVVAQLTERLKEEPDHVSSLIRMSQIFMNEARITGEHGHYYPAILDILNHVLTVPGISDDERFDALSMKSAVLLSQHRFPEARDVALEAVPLRPHNAQIYGALVDAHVELGQYTEAIVFAEKMMDLRPDLLSYSRASYLREIHGDMEGAKEAMDLAVKSGYPGNENTAWCRLTLGQLHEKTGDLEAAEAQYRQALAERPDYPFATAALASVAQKKGEYAQAEELLESAIAVIPEVSFYVQMAELYASTDREEESQQKFQEVLNMMADDELHGHRMDIEYAKAYLHLDQDYTAALQRAMVEYEQRPKNIEVNKLLAQIHFAMGNVDKAAQHLDVATRTNTQSHELLNLKGLIEVEKGNDEVGKNYLLLSKKMNPYQSDMYSKTATELMATL
ncbi:MAG: tetratricopeptide repeat protein [Flavobacteriales bacterium]|nr:tetratricopeptide repeat protein [Flavobacteriales bacterium]